MAAEDTSARKASKQQAARTPEAKASITEKPSKTLGPMPNPFATSSEEPKKKTGRPSSYTKELGDKVLWLLASGKPLTPTMTKEHGLPDPTTIYRWTEANEAFRLEYMRARMFQAHVYADQTLEIADTAEDANLARLQIDARKWYASKVLPKIYGDKANVEVNHTVKIAEEHAAALIELSRRKREAEGKLIDVTPNPSLDKGGDSESNQQLMQVLPRIEDDAG